MSEDLGVLLIKANAETNELHVSNENCIFKIFNLPLKTSEELEAFEEFLVQDTNFNNFVCTFIYYNYFILLI